MDNIKNERVKLLTKNVLQLQADEMLVLSTKLQKYHITFDPVVRVATVESFNAAGHPDFHAGPLEIIELKGLVSMLGIESGSWTIEPAFQYDPKVDKSTIVQTLGSFVNMADKTDLHAMLLISGIDPKDFNRICTNYKVLPHTRIDKGGRYYYTEITAGFPASVIRLRSKYLIT